METYLMPPIYNDLDFKNSWEADAWKSAVNFNIFHTKIECKPAACFPLGKTKMLSGLLRCVIRIILSGT